jgi:hypothetical protein
LWKKILTTIVVIGLTTFSANALERGDFSMTAGIAANSAVYGASAKETNLTDSNTAGHVKNASGVFTETHSSYFLEVNAGELISVGYEHTPNSISTPENKTQEGLSTENKVKVNFDDLNVAYLKVNIPGGLYLKAGVVEVDLDIQEVMGSGRTYKNVSTSGSVMGIGYDRELGDNGFAVRFEGSYMELDDVSTNNGVTATGGTAANGGQNKIDARNLEGLNGKIALTWTFGG